MINNYLKDCRKALMSEHGRQAFSQVAVADKLGVSKSYISRIENGTETPSREFLVRISQVYNIDGQVTLAIGGYLTADVAALFEREPKCITLLSELSKLNSRRLSSFIENFEHNGEVELISALGGNRVLQDIFRWLLIFETSELVELKNALQDYTVNSPN